MNNFLKNEDNKTDLNSFIATEAQNKRWGNKCVFITHGNTVINCLTGNACLLYNDDGLTLEEADNRILCHISHMVENGLLNIKVRSVDTDVIIILLIAYMKQFILINDDVKIWCDFGTGNNRKTVNIHLLYEALGEEICLALPFFHAFTGCDSTTSFYNLPKKKWFELWMSCPMRDDITTVFQQLSWQPKRFSIDFGNSVLNRFVSYAYMKSEMELKLARLSIYTSSFKDSFRILPPSTDALELHILRSCYQAGWIWGNTLSQTQSSPPMEWGWHVHRSKIDLLLLGLKLANWEQKN